jgi:hypothetical protein
MYVRKQQKLFQISGLIIFLFLMGCQTEAPIQEAALTPEAFPTVVDRTSTPTPQKNTQPTEQTTPTTRKTYEYISPQSVEAANLISENFHSLPYGQYILLTMEGGLFAITTDGKQTYQIGTTYSGEPITTDGRILQIDFAYNPLGKTINLLDGTVDRDHLIGQISPDGKWIADNSTGSNAEYTIQITNIESGVETNLPLGYYFDHHNFESFMSDVQWSKDGQYLQYMIIPIIHALPREEPLDPTQPMFGIYQMDAGCLAEPQTCTDHITKIANIHEEMYFESALAFSPDNSLAVINTGSKFIVFNLQTHDRYNLLNTSSTLYSFHYAISPDNQWLAYSGDGTNILIQSIHRGDANTIAADLNHATVLGWLTAPYLQIGDSFKVLPAGDHIYIRENPDLDSDEITFLISGNTFTVLDGPIQEDGYTWWYIHSDVDGMEGWISEFYGWYEKVE